jgi:predicted phosphodiesterase
MKEIIVANDTHYFAPHAIGEPYDLYSYEVQYLLGDIVDLHLAKKDKVNEAKILRSKLYTDFQERYMSGNHALTFVNMTKVHEFEGHKILFTHGDMVFKDKEYAVDYRSKKPGSNSIIRFGAKIVDTWRMNMRNPKIKTKVVINAFNLASEHDCNTIICGHSHRKEMAYIKYHDVNFYVLPRGIHRIGIHKGKVDYLEGLRNYE